jgi:hypothetical protein
MQVATPFCLVFMYFRMRGWIRGVQWIPLAVAVRIRITTADYPPSTGPCNCPIPKHGPEVP